MSNEVIGFGKGPQSVSSAVILPEMDTPPMLTTKEWHSASYSHPRGFTECAAHLDL